MDQAGTVQACKNHPEVASDYYLADHPETRYCSDCALNVALCGRRIEKNLSQEEQRRQAVLREMTTSLETARQTARMNSELFRQLQDLAEAVAVPLEERVRQIDRLLASLTCAKAKLQILLEAEVLPKVQLFQSQAQDCRRNEAQLLEQVQYIESNLGPLLQEQPEQFAHQEQRLQTLILTQPQHQDDFPQLHLALHLLQQQYALIYAETAELRLPPLPLPLAPHQPSTPLNQPLAALDQNQHSEKLVEELRISLMANAENRSRRRQGEQGRRTSRKQNLEPGVKKSLH